MVKTYKVVFTEEAMETLQNIVGYIRRSESESRAKHVEKELLKAARTLVSLPNRNPILATSDDTGIVYRFLSKWQYKIIYTVEEKKDRVIVIRVFHDKQNPEQLEELLP